MVNSLTERLPSDSNDYLGITNIHILFSLEFSENKNYRFGVVHAVVV